MRPLKTSFVIADGARARWVKHSDSADDFVTVRELSVAHPHHGHPQGAALEASSAQHFEVEAKHGTVQQQRVRFAEDVAAAINEEAMAGSLDRLAVVAPARILAAIRQRLCAEANARLARTLSKDLTKTPDHELGHWLRPLARG